MNKVKRCGFPPCKANSTESKIDLKRAGWSFRQDGEIYCPAHSGLAALFPRAEVTGGQRR